MDKMYTVQEVAELLKVNPKTIKRYIEAGKLKASWFGNRWRIKKEVVKQLIDDREQVTGK